uniref:Uncharacterized protein n=1 Tax=Rhodnius prolixus TaxID=13249 RepID=T1HGP0_RHOPR
MVACDTPTNDDAATGEDLFTSFLSADDTNNTSGIQNSATTSATVSARSSPVVSSTKRSEEEENFFNQTSLPSSGSAGGKLDKDSILALYSKGPPPQTSFAQVKTELFPSNKMLKSSLVKGFKAVLFLHFFPDYLVLSSGTTDEDTCLMETKLSSFQSAEYVFKYSLSFQQKIVKYNLRYSGFLADMYMEYR